LAGLRRAKAVRPSRTTSIVHAGEGQDLNDPMMAVMAALTRDAAAGIPTGD
jgi:hypothetical protein